MRFISFSCALLLCGCLVGCGAEESAEEIVEKNVAASGCSGTEVKCAYTGKCENQLELSREKGFGNTPEAFKRYCGN